MEAEQRGWQVMEGDVGSWKAMEGDGRRRKVWAAHVAHAQLTRGVAREAVDGMKERGARVAGGGVAPRE